MDDLTKVLEKVTEDEHFETDANTYVERQRVEQRALSFFLGVHRHPMHAIDAVSVALGDESRSDKTLRAYLDRAFVNWFAELPPRPARSAQTNVGLAGFDVCMSWLDADPPEHAMPLIDAWRNRDLTPETSRMILLLATLQGASARFASETNPVAAWYAHHQHSAELGPREACPDCPSRLVNGPRCLCHLRCERLAQGIKRGGATRQRGRVEQGQAAVEITAWQLVRSHPRTWHQGALRELAWVLARKPVRTDRHDPDAPAELAALGRFLGPKPVSQDELHEVAALIDTTADHAGLEGIATAALSAFSRRLADGKNGKNSEALNAGMAALGRSLSGAFRELRSPLLFEVEPQLLSTAGQPLPKALESLQELPMAEQRNHRWQTATYAYRLALSMVRQWLPQDRQKRWEIEEQLHLGRLGGLALEAEWLLFSHGRTSASIRAHVQEITKHALEVSREDGPLQMALEQAERLADENRTPSSRRGAAPDDEQAPDVLRYSPRWRVMPKIMRARAFVAQAASYTPRERREREVALGAARGLLEELARSDEPTPRHQWEISRIELVAALVEGDLTAVPPLVDAVVRAGGDDGGDFASLASRWRARTLRRGENARELAEVADHLADAGLLTPRLPDLQTIAKAG
ncbi:MAG TPA: hypothetical protein VK778_16965 [Solirubrobacteraceae bacterium]|nr:hypothetical protein [Solirubrobacteraceae bacterium]